MVIDAALSLGRQWFLRTDPWSSGGEKSLALVALHLRSEQAHRLAWRLNLFFLTAFVIVIVAIRPNPRTNNALNGLFVLWFVGTAYLRHRRAVATVAQQHLALSIVGNPRRMLLVRRRDSLRDFAGGGSLSFPWEQAPVTLLFLLLTFSLISVFVRSAASGIPPWNIAGVWRFVVIGIGGVALVFLWIVVRRLNLSAANALQQEIDAIDRTAQSME
jgi:hypothetical protein